VSDRRDEQVQLDLEAAIEEAEQGFDGWDVFSPADDDGDEEAA